MEQSLQVMSKQESLENWRARIMACRSSGMTVRAWCQENGLSGKTHYYILLLAAEVVSDAVGTSDGTRNSLRRGHTAAAGLFWESCCDSSHFQS